MCVYTWIPTKRAKRGTIKATSRALNGGGHADQVSGHLQPMPGPELKIVYIWGLIGPDRLPNPSKKVEALALHLFGGVWRPIGPVWTSNVNDLRFRRKSWQQMARILAGVAIAF